MVRPVPYRLHVRGPSFNNLYAISKMCRSHMLSDIVANIGSIDIVYGRGRPLAGSPRL